MKNLETARSVCRSIGKDVCDFPSVIANDDFYGGLGGEFVIATRSETSGTMAVRHEISSEETAFTTLSSTPRASSAAGPS